MNVGLIVYRTTRLKILILGPDVHIKKLLEETPIPSVNISQKNCVSDYTAFQPG